jgi:hypothetical protein
METQELIREAMRELGKRKKTMTAAAVDQRRRANKASVKSRKLSMRKKYAQGENKD